MMRQTTHQQQALDHLEAAQVYRDTLRETLAGDYVHAQTVNVLRDDIRNAVKLAEVNALLHIGAQLESLVDGRRSGVKLLVGGGADYSEPPC